MKLQTKKLLFISALFFASGPVYAIDSCQDTQALTLLVAQKKVEMEAVQPSFQGTANTITQVFKGEAKIQAELQDLQNRLEASKKACAALTAPSSEEEKIAAAKKSLPALKKKEAAAEAAYQKSIRAGAGMNVIGPEYIGIEDLRKQIAALQSLLNKNAANPIGTNSNGATSQKASPDIPNANTPPSKPVENTEAPPENTNSQADKI